MRLVDMAPVLCTSMQRQLYIISALPGPGLASLVGGLSHAAGRFALVHCGTEIALRYFSVLLQTKARCNSVSLRAYACARMYRFAFTFSATDARWPDAEVARMHTSTFASTSLDNVSPNFALPPPLPAAAAAVTASSRIWPRAAPSQHAQAAIGAGAAKQRARQLNQRADSGNARRLSPVSSPMKARVPAAPPPSPLRHASNDAQAQRDLLAQVSELTRTMGAHTRCVDQRLSALDRCVDQRLSALESSAANTNAGLRALKSSAADTNAGLRALPERLEPVVKRGATSAVQEASPGLVRAIVTGTCLFGRKPSPAAASNARLGRVLLRRAAVAGDVLRNCTCAVRHQHSLSSHKQRVQK